jgi:perosamine synthetase
MADLPAILGGTPLFPDGPPPWPRAVPAVLAALEGAYSSGTWGHYHGRDVPALEAELATAFGVRHVATCASGTLAVEIALRAAGVGPGDEVILAAYDYESTFLSVHHLGAKPVLVDVSRETGQIDPGHLDTAHSPQTKAVVCSHLHGGLADMPTVLAWARHRHVAVIEDAAQCPGAILGGKPAGAWGHFGTLSFGGSKLLSAGRGGAVLTSDARRFQKVKLALQRGVQQWGPLSELQACVLRPQVELLAGDTARRCESVRFLTREIADVAGLVPFRTTDTPAFYKLGLRFDRERFGLSREMFCRAMRAEGVAFDPGFSALHVGRSPSRYRAAGALPRATQWHESCIVLHHPVLLGGSESARLVAEAIRRTYRNADAISRSVS